MKTIPLTQGLEAMVDDDDFEWLSQLKWCAVRLGKRKKPYAARGVNKRIVLMHRVIVGAVPRVDHEDGNTLNNQRGNLRGCTHQQNCFNKRNTTKTTGKPTLFKGVCWHHRLKKWQANICKDGIKIHIGYFGSDESAAAAYDKKAVELFGEFASLNHVAAPVERRIKSPLDA